MIERNHQSIRAVAMGAERTVETTQLALASLAASANGYEIFYSTKRQAPILVKSQKETSITQSETIKTAPDKNSRAVCLIY